MCDFLKCSGAWVLLSQKDCVVSVFVDIIKFLGIPYIIGGRDYTGCDCYGLVYLYLKEQGQQLPVYDFTYVFEDACELINEKKPLLVGESLITPKENCIVLFYRGRHPTHMGVYVDGGVLHTTQKYDSVYEKISVLTRYRKMEFYSV